MKDTLQKFLVDTAPVRGELVEISDTWQQVQARRDYPVAVKTLLGEMLAASALLSANLKFDGMIVMQIHGDGPVKLLVVECDSELQLRATAKLADDVVIADDATLTELINAHGHGRFVITLDPKEKLPGQQPYQGIVPLDGDSVATVIENYMLRSEQLDTKLWLAADDKVSRGLLLQKLPGEGGINAPTAKAEGSDEDTWNHFVMLGNTLRREELLSTDIATLMHRLFWEETVRVFDPAHPSFHCSCSREKVGNMLKMLGREEVEDALTQMDKLGINCDFCGQHYEFDAVDCAQLFAGDVASSTEAGDVRH
ncbi:Hsp33 family molecular chaperone HslO [Herbaspirillum sp. LeCh32-8]|uniref:Hsp33 family molecular chaperone HslO n=1 Tax=Herbaspirillum sp. LeCh32-8 TaxID=2821356 RepID=UPI001AE8F12E|nr:Hsp33 family molecular chaperone HslO [Herbaspirillum sp. LeCh32-8]MBP0600107.1 Hsp33 family molecular chaperone HslO [Herbaspirillum sp. LeCh32-8]